MSSQPSDDFRLSALAYHRAPRPGKIEINPIKEAGQRNGRLNKVTNVDTGEVLGASYLDLDLRR